jgi:hypothetical protein
MPSIQRVKFKQGEALCAEPKNNLKQDFSFTTEQLEIYNLSFIPVKNPCQ